MAQTTSREIRDLVASNLDVAVAQSGNATLLEVEVRDLTRLGVSVAVADQALDAFVIQGKMSADDAYQTLKSTTGHYTTPTGVLIAASGDLTGLTAGSTGFFVLDTRGFHSIKVLASSGNVAGSVVDVYAKGSAGF